MTKNLIAQLLADLDAERAPYPAITQVFVDISRATWPSFFSGRRIEMLTGYVEFNLMAYIFGYADLKDVVSRLARVLDLASRRDNFLIILLSSDLEAEHSGRFAA
ncbi:hypothetical protein [Asticcacaulis sp. AC460]|uniref:hypothetical protein n=1 Tax=Asticcacaulis sp. AC460 TaxID=1282360 RepID=UPI0012DD263A|nr:hypothetical protein [Asticcacaulis sp. AC460]